MGQSLVLKLHLGDRNPECSERQRTFDEILLGLIADLIGLSRHEFLDRVNECTPLTECACTLRWNEQSNAPCPELGDLGLGFR